MHKHIQYNTQPNLCKAKVFFKSHNQSNVGKHLNLMNPQLPHKLWDEFWVTGINVEPLWEKRGLCSLHEKSLISSENQGTACLLIA